MLENLNAQEVKLSSFNFRISSSAFLFALEYAVNGFTFEYSSATSDC